MSKVFIEESTLTAIGDAIRGKTGGSELIAPLEMPTEISGIVTGGDLPEEALVISGDCDSLFLNGKWDWFIENYGERVTTENISNVNYMFKSSQVENIPFEINCTGSKHKTSMLFSGCINLVAIPKINNMQPKELSHIFSSCFKLRYLPEDIENWFDWSYIDGLTTTSDGSANGIFNNCASLRSIPVSLLSHCNKNITSGYNSYFYNGFGGCRVLDELTSLPIPYTATWTSNAFSSTFFYCSRVKDVTFAMPDGAPYVLNWKSQTIDLSGTIGFLDSKAGITNYNSGITADKEVTDDATYQALKDDPDWFTCDVAYSRYNHDSAVATINSLPDTSAYLATAGGTNTIKFKGEAGSATDGGAINTLTDAEIAVATAKGWTVSLV